MDKDTVKKPFSERYPRVFMVIALILMAILVILAIYGIVEGLHALFVVITAGIDRIRQSVEKLDAVIIVALITAVVSIVSVLFSSVISKIIDYRKTRREYLTQKREEPYAEFVDMIYKIQGNSKNPNSYTNKEMLSDLSKFSKKITLWGSPRVVKKWVKFRERGADPTAGTENLFLLEDIMNAMRKDLGLRKVKKGNLLAFFVNDIKKYIN